MRISEITIKNYRSFGPTGQTIVLPPVYAAFVGKNNAGKSNIFAALNLVLGPKNPSYIELDETDFFDPEYPVDILIRLSDFTANDKPSLFAIPNLTKQQMGALMQRLGKGTAEITLHLRRNFGGISAAAEEGEDGKDKFEINLWGFDVHRKLDDVRRAISRTITVHAIRNPKDDLSASTWTQYGQLMKEVLEDSPQYGAIKAMLDSLNSKIEEAFDAEKRTLLRGARVSSYVEDISFQLTRDNKPSELLRNLEIFVKERSKRFNIDSVGTGTQSAIIIAIMELVLRKKKASSKLFCIEEPEAFIHPHGIRYLGTLIKSMSSEQNTQVLLSTHALSLVANFSPREIIRVVKENGETKIIQSPAALPAAHYRRFINQDNAEVFFSDRVVFVEGQTEKVLFSALDKCTLLEPAKPKPVNCNFDRINLGIIPLDSVDSLLSHLTITKAFAIPAFAMADKDFLKAPSCKRLCAELGVPYPGISETQLIGDLKEKGILINGRGEIEDLFTDTDTAAASGKTAAEVGIIKTNSAALRTKNGKAPKTSKAFEEIFGCGKAEYALKIADYYIDNKKPHPLEDIIRKLYKGDIQGITF